MDDIQKKLSELSAKSPKNILYEIFSLRKRVTTGENINIPLMTLYLKSGKDLTGWLLDIDERTGDSILFILADKDGKPSYDVLYMEISSVFAVTLHNISSIIPHLTGKRKIFPSSLTKLELKRKTEEYALEISSFLEEKIIYEILWDTLPQKNEIFIRLLELISNMTSIFKHLGGDDFSKDIIKKSLLKVVFFHSPEQQIELKDKILTIGPDFSIEKEFRPFIDSLPERINGVF